MKSIARKAGKASKPRVSPRASAALAAPAGLPRERADLISELSRLVGRAGSLDLPRTRQALSELVRTAAQEVADRMSTNLRGVRSMIESAARAPD